MQAFVNSDYEKVADALVKMGATTEATIDKAKFGRELQAVINKITTMQPEVFFLFSCHFNTTSDRFFSNN